MIKSYNRAVALISLKNARHNYNEIKSKLNSNVKICCVVKANAYGHGAVELSKLYESLGANFFATATFFEAVQLRKNGIKKPILILGYTPPYYAKKLEDFNLSQTVYCCEYAKELYGFAKKQNAKIKIHLKIDTGFNRIGFVCNNKEVGGLLSAIKHVKNERFILEGIYTHFACSDDVKKGKNFTLQQYKNFIFAVEFLSKKCVNFSIKHAGNSAVIFNYPNLCLDMVRVGLALYGVPPCKNAKNLKPVMTLKTIIESIKTVKKGQNIGYGLECNINKNITLATLPIGYGDGLLRSAYKTNYKVLVNGTLCPFVGRICMDKCMVDVTNAHAKVFNEVVIFGPFKKCNVQNLAIKNGTIAYEVLCQISNRVKRVFN